jgi:penicillin-binding protein A
MQRPLGKRRILGQRAFRPRLVLHTRNVRRSEARGTRIALGVVVGLLLAVGVALRLPSASTATPPAPAQALTAAVVTAPAPAPEPAPEPAPAAQAAPAPAPAALPVSGTVVAGSSAAAGLLVTAATPASAASPAATPVRAAAVGAPAASGALVVPSSILERLPVTRKHFDKLVPGGPDGHRRLSESVAAEGQSAFQVEYSFDPELSDRVFDVLKKGRVTLGHVIVSDPRTGRLLAYASTDTERFSPDRTYPAASLIKIVTAASTLEHAPKAARRDCSYQGSPYRLTRARLNPPKRGLRVSFQRALATSNNQCFAQLAVHDLGKGPLVNTIRAFGFLRPPAAGHMAGNVTVDDDALSLGRLGSGLAGTEITPLHAAQLAMSLSDGVLVEPYWIERVVTANGQVLELPARRRGERAMPSAVAAELREMLIETTLKGTARRAFRGRSGKALLGPVHVAGKTGSLSGKNPRGRYEWFVGVAPAEEPRIAITVLSVHAGRYWRTSSQLAAEILRQMFCPKGVCSKSAADRWLENEPSLSESATASSQS